MSQKEIKYDSVNNVKFYHKGHWFDEDSMRFFNSRLDESAYLQNGIYYFISSERNDWINKPRLYTIRRMNKEMGKMLHEEDNTIFEFQYFKTKAKAKKELLKFLNS